jgi:hypothetical protein
MHVNSLLCCERELKRIHVKKKKRKSGTRWLNINLYLTQHGNNLKPTGIGDKPAFLIIMLIVIDQSNLILVARLYEQELQD